MMMDLDCRVFHVDMAVSSVEVGQLPAIISCQLSRTDPNLLGWQYSFRMSCDHGCVRAHPLFQGLTHTRSLQAATCSLESTSLTQSSSSQQTHKVFEAD